MFTEYANIHSEPTPFEYAKAGSIGAAIVGLPMKIANGMLVKATGTSKPEYICMTGKVVEAGDTIGVIPVIAGRRYMCEATEAIEAPVRGTKYTIDPTGRGITATATSGVAILDGWDGETIEAGDMVTVRF